MKLIVTSIVIGTAAISFASNPTKISKQEYVDQWSGVAVEQMLEYKIPASITLAQGILESANGNSLLAVKGNNHFGIKCHGWKGETIYVDDDRENECFRVYKDPRESYVDHSEFLTAYSRYAFLFDYQIDDYKSWAKGLKRAGYATNPKYPQLLIDIIEDLGLAQYDDVQNPMDFPISSIVVETSTSQNAMQANVHTPRVHERGVKYVVVKNGDTFYKISKEFGLTMAQLRRFNDFEKGKDVLEPGDIIYIQSKKRRNIFKKEEIIVAQNTTINRLAQEHATYASSIRRLNHYSEDTNDIAKGEKVTLR